MPFAKNPYLKLLASIILGTTICKTVNAQQHIDSLKIKLNHATEDSSRVSLSFSIGENAWFQRNLDEAIYYLRFSTSLAEKIKYQNYQANALNLLGNAYMKKGMYDSTLYFLDRAVQQNDSKFNPLIHETYSKVYQNLGDYPTSLQYALKAAEELEKIKDPAFNMQVVYVWLMAGDIMMKIGDKPRALHYYEKAYAKGTTSKTNWYIKTPLQQMANWYLSQNNLAIARHLYDTVLSITKNDKNGEPSMISYEGLGNIAMKENNFTEAINNYRLSLAFAKGMSLQVNTENFYTSLGKAFMMNRQADSAANYFDLAVQQSTLTKNFSNLSNAYRYLSEIEKQKGNHAQALEYYHFYKSFEDSLISAEKIKSLNNAETLYRTRQKENEILRLQKEKQQKDFAIRQRNLYIIIALGLLAALVVILYLVRRNYGIKKRLMTQEIVKMEKEQQVISLQAMVNGQETERTRIARDLHDGLGSLFSTIKMHFSTLQDEEQQLKENSLFKKSYELVNTASTEVRRIAHNMMPEVLLRVGLIDALKDLTGTINSGKLLNISFQYYGMDKRLNASTEIMLYRIIQELLNNIIKHAQATEAIIQFNKDGNQLQITVEDNGRGFNTQLADEKKHAGLDTIQSRVNYLNGKFFIESQQGMGTTVMMDFLINE